MFANDQAHDRLILSPPEWRQVLRAELVASGFEQDLAAVIARRVVEKIVRSYLTGAVESHPLDEAA